MLSAQARVSNRHRAGVVVQRQDLAAGRAHCGAGAVGLLCALSDQERVGGQSRVPPLANQRRHLDVCALFSSTQHTHARVHTHLRAALRSLYAAVCYLLINAPIWRSLSARVASLVCEHSELFDI